MAEVIARVPLAELFTYANEVRSLSQGRAAAEHGAAQLRTRPGRGAAATARGVRMQQIDPELYFKACAVLFDEWDPLELNAFAPCDEYSNYAEGLIRFIWNGADQQQAADRLGEFTLVDMGLTHTDEQRNQQVAQRLILLVRGS